MRPQRHREMTEDDHRKKQVNMRLSRTGRDLLAKIADRYGITHGNVIEMLLRAEAARIGVIPKSSTVISPPPFKSDE